MSRKITLLAFFSLAMNVLMAQQDKLITHFIYDKMSLNPGETGIDDGICMTSLYRNQWDKVNGAPNSALFNIGANLTRFFPGGVGLAFYHDAIAFNRGHSELDSGLGLLILVWILLGFRQQVIPITCFLLNGSQQIWI
jgi:hypothetical protein